mmetsp:Transcript_36750/g.65795  ORF Transcript_36750/g.65795 Transcript_36750/m.65795 type:complete len:257 (-) Transcript_36750:688-1458(-)|eukprot:CAMPEP_0177751824 /NCGR_PEP_ID=MMETSP0491_2-20121128/589_1 /TAXON_ID=63592 /ORGANISM="Tetraselmis chuii, Strain PLY429" /LENGTH=256 /DNA_ID=CAMNT_0019266981 /DNA_START=35 /DNA_END=805 /DNA_ORIENTATION=-
MAESFAATELSYLADTYKLSGEAEVLGVSVEEESHAVNVSIILDRTLFYAEGGGQPSDVGEICSVSDPTRVFQVTYVKADKSGVVRHHGEGSRFQTGERVVMRVDGAARTLHARLHSAGHLLDSCLLAVGGEYSGMEAAKGLHGTTDAYVEYKGKVAEGDREGLVGRLNEEAKGRIAAGGGVQVSVDTYEEAASKVGGQLPPYIPEDSTPRMVTMEGLACPCGGTHVANIREIGGLTVTGIRVKKGITRISYRLTE